MNMSHSDSWTDAKISVVVRTRNEGRWLGRVLTALSLQDWRDVEVVVVDNESTDDTIEVAHRFTCKVVEIGRDEFTYGRAINRGIAAAQGDLVALLSGHCIPLNDKWAERMALNFQDESVAAVYGRQEPLPDTSDYDKRDLWTTFGIERRVQHRDFMFHNANCMIRRGAWTELPFDEGLNGVEDRDWARKAQERGWAIVYEPSASVHHYHGINHGRDDARAARVAKVIELIHRGDT